MPRNNPPSELDQPRDEERYSYPLEMDPELMPPAPTEERRMTEIVRAIEVTVKHRK